MEDSTVIIEGCAKGLEKVKAISLLQSDAGYSLFEAKGIVDSILNGKDVFVHFESREQALCFQEKIESMGAYAQAID